MKKHLSVRLYDEDVDDPVGGVSPTINKIAALNPVEGLRSVILQQEKRVDKLRVWESQLAHPLAALTTEMRLLKEMYGDVIRFQTSTTFLAYLRDNAASVKGRDGVVSAGAILNALAEQLVVGNEEPSAEPEEVRVVRRDRSSV